MTLEHIDDVFARLPEIQWSKEGGNKMWATPADLERVGYDSSKLYSPKAVELVEITFRGNWTCAGYVMGKITKGTLSRGGQLAYEDIIVMGEDKAADGRVSPQAFNNTHLREGPHISKYSKSAIVAYDVLKRF